MEVNGEPNVTPEGISTDKLELIRIALEQYDLYGQQLFEAIEPLKTVSEVVKEVAQVIEDQEPGVARDFTDFALFEQVTQAVEVDGMAGDTPVRQFADLLDSFMTFQCGQCDVKPLETKQIRLLEAFIGRWESAVVRAYTSPAEVYQPPPPPPPPPPPEKPPPP